MNKIIINFSSVTHAMKAKDIVSNMGYYSYLRRKPNPKKGEGCGYSLITTCDINDLLLKFELNKVNYIDYEMV